jgi:hypothetical protein
MKPSVLGVRWICVAIWAFISCTVSSRSLLRADTQKARVYWSWVVDHSHRFLETRQRDFRPQLVHQVSTLC